MSTLNPLWQDTEFDSIFYVEKGVKKKQIQTKDYLPLGKFPIIDQGKEQIVAYSNDVKKLYASTPVIVFGDHTRILKYITFPFVVGADGTQLLKVKNNFSLRFCFYLLQNTKIENLGYSRHMSLLKEKIFTIPPLPEQEKIAEILGCWDLGIEKLSALIDAKKQRKKGLMQKLLTAKIRLPGYSDKWEKKTLGKITVPVIEKVGKKQVVTMSISAKIGFVPQAEKFGKDISGEQYSKYILLPKGAFAYNKGNSKTYPQGCAFRLKNYDEAAVPNVFICFIAKEDCIVPELLEHFFAGNYHGNQLRKVITSSVRDNGLLNLSEDDFYKMELYIPSALSEQKAIADVLSKADEEINLLTKKLSLLRDQKKGLMQKLLTGQIRVKVN